MWSVWFYDSCWLKIDLYRNFFSAGSVYVDVFPLDVKIEADFNRPWSMVVSQLSNNLSSLSAFLHLHWLLYSILHYYIYPIVLLLRWVHCCKLIWMRTCCMTCVNVHRNVLFVQIMQCVKFTTKQGHGINSSKDTGLQNIYGKVLTGECSSLGRLSPFTWSVLSD